MTRLCKFAAAGAVSLMLTVTAAAPTLAHSPLEGGRVGGRSISVLSAEWYAWAWANGFDNSGAFADGDIDCSAGQRGDVWFLAGKGVQDFKPDRAPGGLVGDRTCTNPIPPGTSLFLPLINFEFYNPDSKYCGSDEHCTVPEKRKFLNDLFSDAVPGGFNSRACYLSAAVDGRPVTDYGAEITHTQSPHFPGTGLAAGDPNVVADGFYVLLPPLKPGAHTLDFAGAICTFGGFDVIFGSQVTYKITVAP